MGLPVCAASKAQCLMMFCLSDTFKEAFPEMSCIDFGWLNVEKNAKKRIGFRIHAEVLVLKVLFLFLVMS